MGYDWTTATVTIAADDMLAHRIQLDRERYACLAVRARLLANGVRPARLPKWERRCVPNSLQLLIRQKVRREIEGLNDAMFKWIAGASK